MDNSATGVYRHKLEQAPLFDPKNSETLVGQTGGYTTLAETEEERYRHYQPSHLLNNVKPVAPQQVGPGIGVGPNVSAVGHFHPERDVRVIPTNVNQHRINQLDQFNVQAGYGATQATSKPSVPESKNPPRWHWGRATEPTGGVMTAPAPDPEIYPSTATNRETQVDIVGAPAGVVAPTASQGESTQQLKPECQPRSFVAGPASAIAAPGWSPRTREPTIGKRAVAQARLLHRSRTDQPTHRIA